jgi:hypothetical protein
LHVSSSNLHTLLSVDVDGWLAEIPLIRAHFAQFGTHLPRALEQELDELEDRLRTCISRVGKMSRLRRVSRLGEKWGVFEDTDS